MTEPVGGGQVRMSVFPRNGPVPASIRFCFSNRHNASNGGILTVSCGIFIVSLSSMVEQVIFDCSLRWLVLHPPIYSQSVRSSVSPVHRQGLSIRYDARATARPILCIFGFDIQSEDKVCGVQTGATFASPRAKIQFMVCINGIHARDTKTSCTHTNVG